MFKFANTYKELYAFSIILAILFYFLSNLKKTNLISIIIVILVSYFIYIYVVKISHEKDNDITTRENMLNNDIKDRKEVNSQAFYIDKFPKKLKYLKQSEQLMSVLTNIRFVKKFNKSLYGDLILHMNKLMKIYIYILSNRYDVNMSLQLFIDTRDIIMEHLNSLVMIVPEKMKHTYGFNAYEEIDISINDFTKTTDKMISVMNNYSKIHLGKEHTIDTKYKPYEKN